MASSLGSEFLLEKVASVGSVTEAVGHISCVEGMFLFDLTDLYILMTRRGFLPLLVVLFIDSSSLSINRSSNQRREEGRKEGRREEGRKKERKERLTLSIY